MKNLPASNAFFILCGKHFMQHYFFASTVIISFHEKYQIPFAKKYDVQKRPCTKFEGGTNFSWFLIAHKL